MRKVSVRLLLLLAAVAPAPAHAAGVRFVSPVDGPVVERFHMLSNPYAAGSHRGMDYGVAPDTLVRAAGTGVVSFAGRVAGQGYFVTLRHGGGLETTYSYLSATVVRQGDSVHQGAGIGRSGNGHPESGRPSLHFGARLNGRYIDPERLLSPPEALNELIRMVPVVKDFTGS